MKHKHRAYNGRYMSLTRISEYAIGCVVILWVVSLHVVDANNALESNVESLRGNVFELQVRAGELEIQAAKQIQLSKKEATHIASKRVARVTAYSCIGIKSAKERLMNCPNNITADGSIPVVGKTVACDKSLLGKSVLIKGIGERKCEDTGGAITADRIDLYVSDIATAYSFGVKSLEYTVID